MRRRVCPEHNEPAREPAQAVQIDRFTRHAARVVGGEAAVVARMPVLRGHDKIVLRLDAIDQRHDPVAFGHGKRPARAKVVLDVGDDQGRHGNWVQTGVL